MQWDKQQLNWGWQRFSCKSPQCFSSGAVWWPQSMIRLLGGIDQAAPSGWDSLSRGCAQILPGLAARGPWMPVGSASEGQMEHKAHAFVFPSPLVAHSQSMVYLAPVSHVWRCSPLISCWGFAWTWLCSHLQRAGSDELSLVCISQGLRGGRCQGSTLPAGVGRC